MPLGESAGLARSSMVCLDPARMAIGAEGLAPFWWPLDQTELFHFRDALHERLAALARTAAERDGLLLRCVMPGLLYRAMALYEAAAVVAHSAVLDLRLEVPARSPSLSPLLWSESPVDDALDPRRALLQPFRTEPLWRRAARVPYSRLAPGPIRRRQAFEIDPKRGIVTLALNPSIERMAAASSEPVTYCHPRDWFPTAAPDDGPGCAEDLQAAVADAIRDAAARAGAVLPGPVTDHLRRYVASATALARHHIDRLLARPRRLPRRLWMVSGVASWARPLISAVQLDGGEASGFEHGTGESWGATCGDTQFEFDILDRFICYTPETARRGALQQDAGFRARDARSVLSPLPSGGRGRAVAARTALPAKPRVMVTASLYRQDRYMRYKAGLADPVAVDWQARLFGKLQSWGYAPCFRPHPDQQEGLPDFSGLGVPTANGAFDAAMAEADILLFDLPQTSAWRDALCAGKPVVLVDFGQGRIADDLRALAEQRMAIVPGGFDEQNRVAIDWQALHAALDRAPTLDDPSFVERFFGDV